MATLPKECYCAQWDRAPGDPAPDVAHHPACSVPAEEAKLAAMGDDEPGLVLPADGIVLPSAQSFAETEPEAADPSLADQLRPYFESADDAEDQADAARIDVCGQCSADVDLLEDDACQNCGKPIPKAYRTMARHAEFQWAHCPAHNLWYIETEGECPQCNPLSDARTTAKMITWQEHKAVKATHPEPVQAKHGYAPAGMERDEKGRPVFMRDPDTGEPVCGSRLPRNNGRTDEDVRGRFCMEKGPALYPNGRCGIHGGTTPAGMASPHYIDGRSKRYRYRGGLRIDLLEIYEEAINDPQLTELAEEIAASSALLDSLNKQYKDAGGDGGPLWKQLKEIFQMIALARASTDVKARNKRIAHLLTKAQEIVSRGDLQYSTRGEIIRVTDLLRKLKSAEAKRQRELQLMMPVAEAMNVYTSLTEAVVTNLSDNSLLAPIEGAAKQLGTLIANDAPKEEIQRALKGLKELVGNVSTRPILSRIETDFRRIVGNRKGQRDASPTT